MRSHSIEMPRFIQGRRVRSMSLDPAIRATAARIAGILQELPPRPAWGDSWTDELNEEFDRLLYLQSLLILSL
jgi:hypothetical protein